MSMIQITHRFEYSLLISDVYPLLIMLLVKEFILWSLTQKHVNYNAKLKKKFWCY